MPNDTEMIKNVDLLIDLEVLEMKKDWAMLNTMSEKKLANMAEKAGKSAPGAAHDVPPSATPAKKDQP